MSQSKKRIGIITNFFPPVKYIGSNRMEAFAEYLSEEFEVVVFAEHATLQKDTYFGSVNVNYSPTHPLLDKLKHNPKDPRLVHLTKTVLNVLAHKFIKSPLSSWKKATLTKLIAAHKEHPFDFILSSSPYHESHEVAIDFCQSNPGVKWICDIRDELSTNPFIQGNTHRIARYHALERQINEYAFLVASVSTPLLNTFRNSFPKVNHFLEIKNGFNHDLVFEAPVKRSVTEPFKIGYFGKFYGIHKPDVFFHAVAEMLREKPDLNLEIRFYGTHRNIEIPKEVREKVTFRDHMDYLDAIREMNRMDANLLMIPKFNSKGIYTGKIFDYVSARRPMIAIIDPVGVAADLTRKTNAGYIADYDRQKEIIASIQMAIEETSEGVFRIASKEDVAKLHRKEDIRILKEFLMHTT